MVSSPLLKEHNSCWINEDLEDLGLPCCSLSSSFWSFPRATEWETKMARQAKARERRLAGVYSCT
jgi:hypothetical protein